MKVFDNLKYKIRMARMPVAFPDEDIALLAAMQEDCDCYSKMTKVGLFTYSYYVPLDDSNLNFARHLFEKNGINMTQYHTHNHHFEPRNILRIRDRNSVKGNDITRFMRKVRRKHSDLVDSKKDNYDEWYRLQKVISEQKSDYER